MADDFYLFANCNFVPDKYGDWQAAYDDLAKYVWSSEPNTKAYYFGIPLDYAHDFSKTTSMFAFEIYGTRDDLYGAKGHLSSPAMAKFLELIPAASTTGLDLNHYRLVAGFLDFPGDKTEAAIMQDVKITCTSASARDALLKSLSSLVSSVEKQERENGGKNGVLTYTAYANHDDDVGARIYGRWKSRDDMERFIRRDDVNNFWMGNKEHIRAMEQRGYLPNGKGWLHRGHGYAGEHKL
jgi:quinol monooxygenase YgiN